MKNIKKAKQQHHYVSSVVFMLMVVLSSFATAADMNVLIIGSDKQFRGSPQVFNPLGVSEELKKILAGAGYNKVNIVLEERFQQQERYACINLSSWFHWPYPADVETKTRWPNLRGENGTKWDYVVVIEDSFTIEYLPGLYADGVAKIAQEVAKGPGKTLLLMSWPGANSKSSVAHYQEVVYRTALSGNLLVAPAGLAWEAAGKPTGDTHPSADGAYLTAACIFSTISGKNASTSTYSSNKSLADTAHKIVMAHTPVKPIAGQFTFQNPFLFFNNKARAVSPRKSPGGSSTETYLMESTQDAIKRAGASIGGQGYTIGRDSGSPKTGKDYRLGDPDYKRTTFAYRYQTNTGDFDIHLAEIFVQDFSLAIQVMNESKTFRCLPRRLLWAGLHHIDPTIKPMSSHGHLSGPAHVACATFIYTIISGRCPVDPQPNPITSDWLAQKVGYETAWRLATCQVRAPGFKVVPADVAADSEKGDTMSVQFLFPPQQPVTLAVSCSNNAATVTPEQLTFTSENYNIPQKIVIKAAKDAKPGTEFAVTTRTTSQDIVYHDLSDTWDYKVNNRPVADPQTISVYAGVPLATLLTANDDNGQALTFSIVTQPKLGTITLDGNKLLYAPKPEAVGQDTITFRAHDGLEYSDETTIIFDIKAKSLYDCNLLINATADLGLHGWSTADKSDAMSTKAGGTNGVAYFRAEGDGTAEIYQDVDVSAYAQLINAGKQSFYFAGNRSSEQETHFLVDFLDKDKKVLSSYDSGDTEKPKKGNNWQKTDTTQKAPHNTTAIRVRLKSIKVNGRSNSGSFDELSLTAIKP